jgi:Flp pilus assembly protein TadG
MLRHRRDRSRGQALVEFSIVLVPFLIILMGIFDLGRGIYMMNSTAEAAREIARVTVVHRTSTCTAVNCVLGSSSQAQAVIETQRKLIPGFQFTTATDIVCIDGMASMASGADVTKADFGCGTGDYIRVRVQAPFTPVTPLVSAFGTHTFESYSRIKVP